jgi:hypothetical protein
LVSVWRDPPTVKRVAQADDLPVLLVALYEAEPRPGLFEDWMPLDPRLPVMFRGVLDERSWRFPDAATRTRARETINRLVARGHVDFADLLDPTSGGVDQRSQSADSGSEG